MDKLRAVQTPRWLLQLLSRASVFTRCKVREYLWLTCSGACLLFFSCPSPALLSLESSGLPLSVKPARSKGPCRRRSSWGLLLGTLLQDSFLRREGNVGIPQVWSGDSSMRSTSQCLLLLSAPCGSFPAQGTPSFGPFTFSEQSLHPGVL